jgi:hypothetical protein
MLAVWMHPQIGMKLFPVLTCAISLAGFWKWATLNFQSLEVSDLVALLEADERGIEKAA